MLTNQPPSTETTFSKLCSQPGSWKERDPAVTTLSISILLLPNTDKDISKTFKNNFQTTQGWKEKRERKVTVNLLANSDNDNTNNCKKQLCVHTFCHLLFSALGSRQGRSRYPHFTEKETERRVRQAGKGQV